MLKKTIVLGSILTSICAAPTLAYGSCFKSGFFAGAHAGASFGRGSFNNLYNPNIAGLPEAPASGKATKTSGLLGIIGGYRHIFHEGYTIGLDVSGNIFLSNDLKKQLNHIPLKTSFPFTDKLSRRFSVIPSINFGKVFYERWHVALGLGLGISGFRQQVNAPFPNSNNPINTAKSSSTKLGFVPSVGVEYAATHNISVLGNVSYEIYKNIRKQFGPELTAPSSGTYTSSINPRYITLKVGAIYRF